MAVGIRPSACGHCYQINCSKTDASNAEKTTMSLAQHESRPPFKAITPRDHTANTQWYKFVIRQN